MTATCVFTPIANRAPRANRTGALRRRLKAALDATTDMSEQSSAAKPYQETVSCEPRQDEGIIFIKVVAMPYEVRSNLTSLRPALSQSVFFAAVEVAELGWAGKSGLP